MRNLNAILKIARYTVVAVVVFIAFYYLKYRPTRNKYHAVKSANVQLQKQLQEKDKTIKAVWLKYYELSKMPRYQIDQHLEKIKVKKGSKFDFIPKAIIEIKDSTKTTEIDSLIIKRKSAVPVENKQRRWWQFWKAEREPT